MKWSTIARRIVVATALALVTAGGVWACPFCSAPSLTLNEQLLSSQAAVLVQWKGGKPADRDSGFPGTTDYEIVQIVSDSTKALKKGETIVLDRYRAGMPGDLFMLLGSAAEKIEWSSPLEVTETSFNYMVQAPSKETPAAERMAYFLKFLEYPDSLISNDAYGEFANAPYQDIVQLAPKMDPVLIRKWLEDKNTMPTRIGLYGLMLGLCGQKDDAAFLEQMIQEPTEGFRLGIDGVMGGYLLLKGPEGLDIIERDKLVNQAVPFSETFAAMQALRFMWTYGEGQIAPDRLRQSMRILLDRPNLADLVIVDLARWNDWDVMPRLMEMYTEPVYDVSSIKRAIVRFLLIAEKSGKDAAIVPPQVEAAKKNLALLRETDPKTVKAAERYFFD